MKRSVGKSHCPINFCLEIVGDQWSLLIMRDILIFGKSTYNDFLNSDEKISTNILADRLEKLLNWEIIEKQPNRTYRPTQKGLELTPILTEMGLWGVRYDKETDAPAPFKDWAKNDPATFRKNFVKGG